MLTNTSIFYLNIANVVHSSPFITLEQYKNINIIESRYIKHFSTVFYGNLLKSLLIKSSKFYNILESSIFINRGVHYSKFIEQSVVEFRTDVKVIDCYFAGCNSDRGGGVHTALCDVLITKTEFSHNIARIAGGLYCLNCNKCEIVGVSFVGNMAEYNGAAFLGNQDRSIELELVNFSSNTATEWNSAIRFDRNGGTMKNSYFEKNKAHSCGCIFDFSWKPNNREVSFCNFINNTSLSRSAAVTLFHILHQSSYQNCNFALNICKNGPNSILVMNIYSNVSILNCTFDKSSAEEIKNEHRESILVIKDCQYVV